MAIVLGTAGHIDHGKTSLIRALTGTDCDRLAEEKRRGITIELGFTRYELPDGSGIGIVDVPGHERFVRAMVAGASGIDAVLLVIAADEGVMPQTREHLEICSLLGIRAGLIALTKIDLVDPEWLELARSDVRSFVRGTMLENAPIFPVSSATGKGLDELGGALAELNRTIVPARRPDLFRMPVDRVFSLRGHGTVVTGTVLGGCLKEEDPVATLPSGREFRARSLQSHGARVERVTAGQRAAINLAGAEVSDIGRGDVLAVPGTLAVSDAWIVELTALSSMKTPLKNRTEAHFHHGTRDAPARLRFFDRDRLMPGDTALCRVSFPRPIAGVFGDRFVLRGFSPLRTLGGGIVSWPEPIRPRARDTRTLELLRALPGMDARDRTLAALELAGTQGADPTRLSRLTNIESKALEKILRALQADNRVFRFDRENRTFIDLKALEALCSSCEKHMREFHEKNPDAPGLTRAELLSGWGGGLSPKLVHFTAERLIREARLENAGDALRLAGHVPAARDNAGENIRRMLLEAYAQAKGAPPNAGELMRRLELAEPEAEAALKNLCLSGELVRVSKELYYIAPELERLRADTVAWLKEHETITPAEFREMSGLSRKYAVALLEYFDRVKTTMRVGDERRLRRG